ncbi:glycosyltransferase family 4 protein [Lactobacillus crispatus]|uniref:glycosyltransferase family 4 protein n=1 Tax=Lactobacillus crispatus TaxID=47770 RepID=UPI0015DD7E55|nr:glycosyltransferase family 4 protein [Lactobacillus crispatus]QLK32465.1 glycosyltransferase family 4 protein [Lactobacillus crispatus]
MKLSEQNILYIARAPIHGGTENVVLQLCEIFQPIANKIVVCAGKGFNQEPLRKMEIKFYVIPDLENKNPLNVMKISAKLKHIVKAENITVIHTHHRMAAFYVSLLRLYKKCIFINTSHNTFFNKIKLTRFAYNHAHLIACGKMVKENLVNEFGLKDVTVIHNAVKPFEGPIAEEPILKELHKQGYFLVGNVGRLTEQKGFKYFIESIPLVLKQHPKTKFVIIGSGELEASLKELANKLKVSSDIIWLGYRKDVQNLMSQLDLIVLSSLWEGLPLTPIEAFSVGRAVVATAVDGTVEEVKDGLNGYLVSDKDSKMLAEKIVKAINNDSKLEGFAKKTYTSEFTFDIFSRAYINFYKNMEKSE